MQNEPVVHIVDDDPAARDSLAFLLESAGFQPKVYDSARHFVAALPALERGCVVTDVRMPDVNGLELVRLLKEKKNSLPVIVITGHGDVALAVEAMKAGASDFIEKPFDGEVMIAGIRAALERPGAPHAPPAQWALLASRIEALSPRERQVLEGLVAGKANKVIAAELAISPRTVEVYRANLMSKMNAASLSDLVRMALQAGL